MFHPLAMPQVIEDCFTLLLDKATAIPDPFEQAFFLMVQLPYLQPFEDVNKRVSRIGANIPLIKHKLCPMSFIDVPDRVAFAALLTAALAHLHEGSVAHYRLRRWEYLAWQMMRRVD